MTLTQTNMDNSEFRKTISKYLINRLRKHRPAPPKKTRGLHCPSRRLPVLNRKKKPLERKPVGFLKQVLGDGRLDKYFEEWTKIPTGYISFQRYVAIRLEMDGDGKQKSHPN